MMDGLRIGRPIAAAIGLGLVLLCAGCGGKLVVDYEQVSTCKTWSDVNDDPGAAYQHPLVVFRIVGMTNNADDPVEFVLNQVYFQGAVNTHTPESTAIDAFQPFVVTLSPGESLTFPNGLASGAFAIQLLGEQYDELTLINLAPFLRSFQPEVRMVRDPNIHGYKPYCGRTMLSNH